jgi:hypothetical protein
MRFSKQYMWRISLIPMVLAALVSMVSAQDAKKIASFTVTADSTAVCAGGKIILTAKKGDAPVTPTWVLAPPDAGSLSPANTPANTSANTQAKIQAAVVVFTAAGKNDDAVASAGEVTITATLEDQTQKIVVTLAGPCLPRFGGELTRAVVGFEQIGASGTSSDQKYFFDFFISRPIC